MSWQVISACSGLMYSGVPMIWPCSVCNVRSVSGVPVARATPKIQQLYGTRTQADSSLQQILAVSGSQVRKRKNLVTCFITRLYFNSPSRARTYNLAVNRKHSENCRKAQKSIVFNILASFWIFARVRILSHFFASFRGI
jgi:hypothetical protein